MAWQPNLPNKQEDSSKVHRETEGVGEQGKGVGEGRLGLVVKCTLSCWTSVSPEEMIRAVGGSGVGVDM